MAARSSVNHYFPNKKKKFRDIGRSVAYPEHILLMKLESGLSRSARVAKMMKSTARQGEQAGVQGNGPPENRLQTLCDGVFAIAMTLLVLDIRLPAPT